MEKIPYIRSSIHSRVNRGVAIRISYFDRLVDEKQIGVVIITESVVRR